MKKIYALILSSLLLSPAAFGKTVKLKLEGMSCGVCSGKAEKALKKVEGIKVIKVEVGSAIIEVPEGKNIMTEEFKEMLTEKGGFKVSSVTLVEDKKN